MRPYHRYAPDQGFLLPASLAEAIDAGDPVFMVREAVSRLDLRAIHRAYRSERGRPPFHPEAMVGLLLYGACQGIYSSRRLEKACGRDVAFMYIMGNGRPDFHTIAQFRKRFRPELVGLFRQVLALCRAAGGGGVGPGGPGGGRGRGGAPTH